MLMLRNFSFRFLFPIYGEKIRRTTKIDLYTSCQLIPLPKTDNEILNITVKNLEYLFMLVGASTQYYLQLIQMNRESTQKYIYIYVGFVI